MGVYLKGVNLTKAILKETKLNWAFLRGANLTEANLESANLTEANLNSAILTGVSLNNANLIGANLKQTNLSNTKLNNAILRGVNLTRANLQGAILTGADLNGATWSDGSKCMESSIGWCNNMMGCPKAAQLKYDDSNGTYTYTDPKGSVWEKLGGPVPRMVGLREDYIILVVNAQNESLFRRLQFHNSSSRGPIVCRYVGDMPGHIYISSPRNVMMQGVGSNWDIAWDHSRGSGGGFGRVKDGCSFYRMP